MCRYKYELSFGTMANKYGCGCTGIRNCSLCQAESNAELNTSALTNLHWFCPLCDRIFPGNIEDYISTFDDKNWCEMHKTEICSVSVEGICVVERFIDDKEENLLLDSINRHDWKLSQSGRRKQDYGPKANFKRKKLKIGTFTGLPSYSQFLVDRMRNHKWLTHFFAVELCNLEYTRERGSSIDPHMDDTWLWGDVLVTVNLKSNTILTLSMNRESPKQGTDSLDRSNNKTNDSVNTSDERTGDSTVSANNQKGDSGAEYRICDNFVNSNRNSPDSTENRKDGSSSIADNNIEVQIPMPRKSLLLLGKDARYRWLHSIKRRHIQGDRYAMTFRNLSEEFSEGGPQYDIGKALINIANTFEGNVAM